MRNPAAPPSTTRRRHGRRAPLTRVSTVFFTLAGAHTTTRWAYLHRNRAEASRPLLRHILNGKLFARSRSCAPRLLGRMRSLCACRALPHDLCAPAPTRRTPTRKRSDYQLAAGPSCSPPSPNAQGIEHSGIVVTPRRWPHDRPCIAAAPGRADAIDGPPCLAAPGLKPGPPREAVANTPRPYTGKYLISCATPAASRPLDRGQPRVRERDRPRWLGQPRQRIRQHECRHASPAARRRAALARLPRPPT